MTITKNDVRALSNNFHAEGFHNANHSYVMPVEHSNDDIERTSYWAFTTKSVIPGDFITVRKADHSFVANLYVKSVIKNVGLQVSILDKYELSDSKPLKSVDIDDFDINFNPKQKWRIISKTSKAILASDFSSKDEAQEYLNSLTDK